jgi:hypothetical protein
MYTYILPIHSLVRWLVVIGLLYCLIRSIIGVSTNSKFTKLDNFFRSFTSGISHLQLILGFILYFKSPIVSYFRENFKEAVQYPEFNFFGIIHIALMFISVILLTIGASKAKRAETDKAKHRQILIWFSLATLLIFLAIPWVFSPYVARPNFRGF